MKVQCWGPGAEWRTPPYSCTATLPDSRTETLIKNGWGFTYGIGLTDEIEPFYACPEHKDPEPERTP